MCKIQKNPQKNLVEALFPGFQAILLSNSKIQMQSNFRKKIAEIIRVNHAGEFGAKVIYSGQIAAMKLTSQLRGESGERQETLKIVEKMKRQEDKHFEYFDAKIKNEKTRPTLMQPVWRVGGFALGFLTALAGKKAAMTCTVAVEEVIDEHYQDQLSCLEKEKKYLDEDESKKITELKEKISKFREEELEHRDIGYENQAAEMACFGLLSKLVKCTTKFAIAVSKRV